MMMKLLCPNCSEHFNTDRVIKKYCTHRCRMKYSAFMQGMKNEIKRFKQTGVPRCPVCHKDMIKVDEYTWMKDCEHNSNVRLSLG